MNDKIKLAIIGIGSMGEQHVKSASLLSNTELVALCDVDELNVKKVAGQYNVPFYTDANEVLAIEDLDAVLIATPHYDHTTIAISAFEREVPLHVLTEKPVGVHTSDIEKMIVAYDNAKERKPDLKFGAIFQQRTLDHWKKIKNLVASGELGKLIRMTWTITDWFRTQCYYDNGGWRGTWKGEGGGVLLNQCPHNLDLFTWIGGMPNEVIGVAEFGKHHNIEVEDEVTGLFRYDNGMVGHFITSTGEFPGSNLLEIAGENGKIIFDGKEITYYRNVQSSIKYCEESKNRFGSIENWECKIPFSEETGSPHKKVIENFCDSILTGCELVAPAVEGMNSVALSNAILLSQLKGNAPVKLPFDNAEFIDRFNRLIDESTFVKNDVVEADPNEDFSKSH